MNSWCSRCALFTSAMVGSAILASTSVSPGWFMPTSMTASRCAGLRRSKVSGNPTSLLKLPAVASRSDSPTACPKIDAIISLTVVLPLLPVTATSGSENRLRQPRASAPSASRVSGTISAGTCQPSGKRVASTALTPRAATSGKKSWASNRSPFSATNNSPAAAVRLSVLIRSNPAAPSPNTVAPGISAAASASESIVIARLPADASHARQARGGRGPDRRKCASCP